MSGPTPRRIAVVTGGNSGIGKEVAAGLLERGDHVILACRRLEACEAARQELSQRRSAAGGATLPGTSQCAHLDLCDLASVRAFSADFMREKQQLSVLVNNAAVMGAQPGADGGDGHFLPNHLGAFLLTRLLLPAMAQRGRVVTVSSEAHYRGTLEMCTDSTGRCSLGGPLAQHWYPQYARSKLANTLMTAELSRRLLQRGSSVQAFSVSPGRVNTNISRQLGGPLGGPVRLLASLFFQTPAQGAQTVLQAATSPELQGRHVLYMHAGKAKEASAAARDPSLAAKLWELSVQDVGMSPEEDASLYPKH